MPADTGPTIDKLAKVFEPVIVIELTDVDVKLNVPNDNPPKAIVVAVTELLIVDDPALKVKFVVVESVNEDDDVIVLVPKVIDRVFVLLDDRFEKDSGKFPVSKDPFVTVSELPNVVENPRVQPQPTPLISVLEASTTPFVVNVLPVAEPVSVIAPL